MSQCRHVLKDGVSLVFLNHLNVSGLNDSTELSSSFHEKSMNKFEKCNIIQISFLISLLLLKMLLFIVFYNNELFIESRNLVSIRNESLQYNLYQMHFKLKKYK